MKTAIKIICLLVALSLAGAMSVPSAYAEAQRYEKAANALVGLKILEGYEDGTLGLDKVIKRAEFVTIIARMLGLETVPGETRFADVPSGHWASGAIEACRSMGIVSGHSDTVFGPEEPLAYSQAIKVLVTLLGYDIQAEGLGGYPLGYVITANQIGLTKNAAGEADDILRRGIVAQMIYNALHIEVAEVTSFGAEDIRTITSGVTFLNSRLDIHTGNGIVEETSRSGLAEIGTLPKNQVKIGGEIFETGETEIHHLLGYDVTYYAKKSNDTVYDTLVYVEPHDNRNTVETISADNIMGNSPDFSKQSFVFSDDRGNIVLRRISPYADLIYNGVTIGGFKALDMCPSEGHVTLLDNNADGVYDVIFVTEYEIFAVSSIGGANTTVYDLYDKNKSVDLVSLYQDSELIVTKNGRAAQVAEIQRNNILSVASSKNTTGIRVIEVLISDEAVTGVLTEKTDSEIVIDGKEYKLAKNLLGDLSGLKIGLTGKFYLSALGTVAAFEGQGAKRDNLEYGYLIYADVEGGISSQCLFKLLTAAGGIQTVAGADTIWIDGDYVKDKSEVVRRLQYEGEGQETRTDQLIRYSMNSKGEINAIDTVCKGEKEDENGLTLALKTTKQLRYMSGSYTFGSEKPELMVDSNTVVFFIPENRDDESKYVASSMSFFKASEYYEFSAYDLTEGMIARAILVDPTGSASSNVQDRTPVSLITSVSDAVGPKGEETKKLTVIQSGKNVSFYCNEETVKEAVAIGEFVRLGTDSDGYINEIQRVVNPHVDSPTSVGLGTNDRYFFSTWRVVYGVIVGKVDKSLLVSTDLEPPRVVMPYMMAQSTRITIYKTKTQSFSNGSVQDIEDYVFDRNPSARAVVITSTTALVDVILIDFSE